MAQQPAVPVRIIWEPAREVLSERKEGLSVAHTPILIWSWELRKSRRRCDDGGWRIRSIRRLPHRIHLVFLSDRRTKQLQGTTFRRSIPPNTVTSLANDTRRELVRSCDGAPPGKIGRHLARRCPRRRNGDPELRKLGEERGTRKHTPPPPPLSAGWGNGSLYTLYRCTNLHPASWNRRVSTAMPDTSGRRAICHTSLVTIHGGKNFATFFREKNVEPPCLSVRWSRQPRTDSTGQCHNRPSSRWKFETRSLLYIWGKNPGALWRNAWSGEHLFRGAPLPEPCIVLNITYVPIWPTKNVRSDQTTLFTLHLSKIKQPIYQKYLRMWRDIINICPNKIQDCLCLRKSGTLFPTIFG